MFLDGNGGSPTGSPVCCCCQNCCHKFCGDEEILNGLVGNQLALSGDKSWEIQPQSSVISLTANPDPPYCGVRFDFLVTARDAVQGTSCKDMKGFAWLCSQDHRPQGLLDCVCSCHWHVDVEACEGSQDFCSNDCEWIWNGQQMRWENLQNCEDGCSCPEPEIGDGLQDGDLATTFCNVNDFQRIEFIGGDNCLDAYTDAPNCGDAGDLDIAAAEIYDPDLSVRCCCLGSYDVGEI